MVNRKIYIPIWLDLLLIDNHALKDCNYYLHSNMVRFIILACCKSSGIYPLIYIPIWLDLLFKRIVIQII